MADHAVLPHQDTESKVTRSLRRFVEGVSDPTLLISRDLLVLYANAEARVRFSKADPTENSSFEQFVRTVFPECSWTNIEQTFAEILLQQNADSRLVLLVQGPKQTHMRITV